MDPKSLQEELETVSTISAAPEFEFCVDNSVPSKLVSADELFADGFLLPLHQTTLTPSTPKPFSTSPLPPTPSSGKSSCLKEICKSIERDHNYRRRERNNNSSSSSTSAELNINLWPFSRSRSARTGSAAASRLPRSTLRRAHSAPCSCIEEKSSRSERYSSTAEFLTKKNGTGGIRISRAGPVWQIRRFGKNAEKEGSSSAVSSGIREKIDGDDKIVQSCIGYRNCTTVRCSAKHSKQNGSDQRNTTTATINVLLLNFRSLLSTKKVVH